MHPFDGRVVSNFIRQGLAGDTISMFGDGSQTRSFCYVSDLIDGFLRMMDSPAEFTGPVNLGNPNEFTIMELAQKTIAMTGGKARLGASRPLPPDDPKQRKPDITLARERLGWEPKVQLAEGLQHTIDWMKAVDLSDFRAPTPNY